MRNTSNRVVMAIAAGAGALLLCAPTAAAQNPPPCAPDDQQCQQQQSPGAGIVNDIVDGVLDPANRLPSPDSGGGPGIMVLKDGVPWCMPLNQPIPPGVVLTSPTGNGVSSYC